MEPIEQVAFTCRENEHYEGQVPVVASTGVREDDIAKILAWGPSRETLLPHGPEDVVAYAHPLPSGALAVGRVWSRGGGSGVSQRENDLTHCLVVPPRVLDRFANNPFVLLHTAQASGALCRLEELPCQLHALRLEGRTAVVDTALLRQLRLYPGPEWMAALVQSALNWPTTAVFGGIQAEYPIAGVLNFLPPECRCELSFSIGLRFSERRPYRLVGLARDVEEHRRMSRLSDVAVLDIGGRLSNTERIEGSWGSLVHRVLTSGRISYFAGQLARRPLDFTPRDLPFLGLQLLEEFDTASNAEETCAADWPVETSHDADAIRSVPDENRAQDGISPKVPTHDMPVLHGRREQAHASRGPMQSPGQGSAAARREPALPSQQLPTTDPVILEKLERLDDLVFDAIAGSQEALEDLKAAWPDLRKGLDSPLLDESREQYLRYALAAWQELANCGGVRRPSVAMHSLDVLSTLFGDDR